MWPNLIDLATYLILIFFKKDTELLHEIALITLNSKFSLICPIEGLFMQLLILVNILHSTLRPVHVMHNTNGYRVSTTAKNDNEDSAISPRVLQNLP